jgi:hypothetical protein
MVKLLQGQPALGVVLAQAGGRRLAVGVCDARARSGSHVILRVLAEPAVLLARRYISIRPWASHNEDGYRLVTEIAETPGCLASTELT